MRILIKSERRMVMRSTTIAVRRGDAVLNVDPRVECFECGNWTFLGLASPHLCQHCGQSIGGVFPEFITAENLASRWRVSVMRIVEFVKNGELATHRPDVKASRRSVIIPDSISLFLWNRSNYRCRVSWENWHNHSKWCTRCYARHKGRSKFRTCEYCGRLFCGAYNAKLCPKPPIYGATSTCVGEATRQHWQRMRDKGESDRRSRFMQSLFLSGKINERVSHD